MAAISLSSAFTALSNVMKDVSDVPSGTFLQWCQYLSDFAYRITSDIDPERFITEVNISVSPNVTTYALPDDFKNHQEMGTGLFKQNNGNSSDNKLALTGFGSSSQGYYISGSNFVLTPIPQQSLTLVNRYIPNGPNYTGTSDYFTLDKLSTGKQILPGEYLLYVQNSLQTLYEIWDQDAPLESYADARFVRTLDELARNINRPPLAVGLADFSQSF